MKNLRANCLQVKVFLHNEGQCENDFWGRLNVYFSNGFERGLNGKKFLIKKDGFYFFFLYLFFHKDYCLLVVYQIPGALLPGPYETIIPS